MLVIHIPPLLHSLTPRGNLKTINLYNSFTLEMERNAVFGGENPCYSFDCVSFYIMQDHGHTWSQFELWDV